MTVHTLHPRPAAQVIDIKARRTAHPASIAAMLQFETQRAAHLARRIGEADAVLLAVAADLRRLDEIADATDAESCVVRREIVRRAGEAIMRFRRPELLAPQQTGSAS